MIALLSLLLSGCLTAERFDTRLAEERCMLLSDCEVLDLYGHSSEEQCLQETAPTADECETFDRTVASDCLDRMAQMGCGALQKDRFPSACDQVCGED